MVLAIGLLVDDAIVVVEDVERVMMEDKLAERSDGKIDVANSGALVGIAMVLSAVFIPMAFFGGSTGAIYRQFSITIVSAMALSVLVALILTPRYVQHCSNPPQLSITKIRVVSSAGLIPPSIIALTTTPTASAKSSVPQDDINTMR
ncbi:efflux RND transporter permease subunit [Escherichia coli]